MGLCVGVFSRANSAAVTADVDDEQRLDLFEVRKKALLLSSEALCRD